MGRRNLLIVTLAAGALVLLGGCQLVGPTSIGKGRDSYNTIIQRTSMEQTMSNIVRVYHHEPPLFMDVTEVDATVSFTGSMTGASTNIGAKHGNTGSSISGQVGSAGGTLQYAETPTIRYQPILGQALVAQLVTPVSVDALGLLYDSSWKIAPLLDFSVQYLTLDPHEFYLALDTIQELASEEAVELSAAPSILTNATSSNSTDTASSSKKDNSASNNSLVIYLLPFRQNQGSDDNTRILQLWVRMFRFYYQNQPPFSASNPKLCASLGLAMNQKSLQKWDAEIDQRVKGTEAQKSRILDDARTCLPNFVELRVVPAPREAGTAHANSAAGETVAHLATHVPLMRTYSALGILKNATERPSPRIEFVTLQQYRKIHDDELWNRPAEILDYYTLLPGDLDSVDCPAGGCDTMFPPTMPKDAIAKLDSDIAQWLQSYNPANPGDAYQNGINVYERPGADVLDSTYAGYNGRLGTLRRYILVVVTDDAPSDPTYVSYTDGQRWYSIANDDEISQKNFQLLSLIMTMMAIPPTTQPLSPVISVGG